MSVIYRWPDGQGSDRELDGRKGDTLLDLALDNGVTVAHECGGNCACTTCHVIVEKGLEWLSPAEEVEVDRLSSAAGWTARSRLACQAIIMREDRVLEDSDTSTIIVLVVGADD